MQINTLCQCCKARPRTKAMLIYNECEWGGPDIWLLCNECTQPHSKFSPNYEGNKDVTDKYNLTEIYLRDINHIGDGFSRGEKSFFFRLKCSDGSLGDVYQFVPGLNIGHTKLQLFNVTKNRLERNGWWDWPIIPYAWPFSFDNEWFKA